MVGVFVCLFFRNITRCSSLKVVFFLRSTAGNTVAPSLILESENLGSNVNLQLLAERPHAIDLTSHALMSSSVKQG